MTATAPEPTEHVAEQDGGHRVIYWVIGVIVVVLAVIGLITYGSNKATADAKDKAQQLTQAFQQAGLRVPQDQDIIVKSLGTDGGAVCDNPASALGRAVMFDLLANGASQVGRRPVIVDRRVIQGQALIMQVYCPDKLPQFREKFDDLKFDDTLGD
jgi:hypothetical protein